MKGEKKEKRNEQFGGRGLLTMRLKGGERERATTESLRSSGRDGGSA